jgi:hypothetical protein
MVLQHKVGMHLCLTTMLKLNHTYNYKLLLITLTVMSSISACTSSKKVAYNVHKKYAPSQIQYDFSLLQKILEREHPSTYWHTPKPLMDSIFTTAKTLLNDSLTEFEFRKIVAQVVSNVKCGHTSVRGSKGFDKWLSTANLSYFPFGMRVFSDTMIATYNLYRKDTLIPRGSIIQSINGINSNTIMQHMYSFISTDGDANNFKNLRISNNFPFYYLMAMDSAKTYNVQYLDSVGNSKEIKFTHFKRPPPDTTKTPKPKVVIPKVVVPKVVVKKPTKEQRRQLIRKINIDTVNSTAVLILTSFSGGKQQQFFKTAFANLQKLQIKNLVIDVRNNGGGLVANATALSKYFITKKTTIADSVYTNKRMSKYNKYIKRRFWFGLSTYFFTNKKNDGNYHFGWFSRKKIKPKKHHHFDGKVYAITGGYSFSATTLFLHYIQPLANVTTVGETTGGSAYGNTAIYIPDLTLPNTKIKVRMPMFRLVMNKNATTLGQGIAPQIYVPPTPLTMKKGNDNKLEKVLELIKLDLQQNL